MPNIISQYAGYVYLLLNVLLRRRQPSGETVTGGVTTIYAYDGWGTLIRETRNGLTTDLVLDEQVTLPRVLAAIRSDGQEELYAYGPEGLHAQRSITGTTDTLSYALLDAQGSLTQLTDTRGVLLSWLLGSKLDYWDHHGHIGSLQHATMHAAQTSNISDAPQQQNEASGCLWKADHDRFFNHLLELLV